MSSPELRALLADKPEHSSVDGRTRLSVRRPGTDMAEAEQIAGLESKLKEAQQKVQEQKDEFERANEEETD